MLKNVIKLLQLLDVIVREEVKKGRRDVDLMFQIFSPSSHADGMAALTQRQAREYHAYTLGTDFHPLFDG